MEFTGNKGAQASHTFGVPAGGVVPNLGHSSQKLEGLQLGPLEFGRAQPHQLFKKVPGLLKSQVGEAGIEK